MTDNWGVQPPLRGDLPGQQYFGQQETPFVPTMVAEQPAAAVSAQQPAATPPQPVVGTAADAVPQESKQAGAERKEIPQLLKEFSKKQGCEEYRKKAKQLDLLSLYLFLRQLTTHLSFELFLDLFANFADSNKENLKIPADAINRLLPRTKKAAEETGLRHWSADKAVDYVSLYVDMVREAEASGTPVPMEFNAFLSNEKLIEMFDAGAFDQAAAEKPKEKKKSKQKEIVRVRPSKVGDRVLHTQDNGRQFRGVVLTIWGDVPNQYLNVRADSGEELTGISVNTCEVITDPLPHIPDSATGEQLPLLGEGVLRLSSRDLQLVHEAVSLPVAMGTVPLNEEIYRYVVPVAGYNVLVLVKNADTGPYVTAVAEDQQGGLHGWVQPRKNIQGMYQLFLSDGYLSVEVR